MFLQARHLFFAISRIGDRIYHIYTRKLALILKTPKITIYDSSLRKYGDTLIKSRENSKLTVYILPKSNSWVLSPPLLYKQ